MRFNLVPVAAGLTALFGKSNSLLSCSVQQLCRRSTGYRKTLEVYDFCEANRCLEIIVMRLQAVN